MRHLITLDKEDTLECESSTIIDNDYVSTNIFAVDYSKNGKARCKVCREFIDKGNLRIGKLVAFKEKHFYHFYHLPCAFHSFKKARIAKNVITSLTDLDGAEQLTENERNYLNQLIKEYISCCKKKLPEELNKVSHKHEPRRIEDKVPAKSSLKQTDIPSFKIMYTNIDQMTVNKMIELTKRVESERPLLVAITEVNLKVRRDTHVDINIPGYTPHRINETSDKGRGIAVFTHESIDKSVIQITSKISFEEACILEVRLRGGDTLLFCCCYRSPTHTDSSSINNKNLLELIRIMSSKKYSHLCIVGDFNYRQINWKSWSTENSTDSDESIFIETLRDCYLFQHVSEPTRRRGDDEPSILDLVLSNEELQVSDIIHQAPIGKSDHDVLCFRYHCYIDYQKQKTRFNFAKGNYVAMKEHLANSRWTEKFSSTFQDHNIEQNWLSFKNKILDLKDKFIPKETYENKPKWGKKGTFPIDKNTREEMKTKNSKYQAWKRAPPTLRNEARISFTRQRNKVRNLLRKAKRKFEKGVSLKCKTNPKAFWAYTRSKLRTKCCVAPLLSDPKNKESLEFDDEKKANILQTQFLSVFTTEDNGTIPTLPARTMLTTPDLVIHEHMVLEELKNLNANKSCGPDEIHPKLLSELADYLVSPLTKLFNQSLEGTLPADWKRAFVSPIFKKGARNLAVNYRPISLTSIVCKIMEKFIRRAVLDHLTSHELLSEKQHGFLTGRSILTQLLKYLDDCANIVSQGGVVDAIYLDFWKAFDTVPHRRLLGKLKSYGVNGVIHRWIESFLTGRTQEVQVNGTRSRKGAVTSGIPQGSVLGPILFLVYINDLLDNIDSFSLLFADDTKIYRKILTKEDSEKLQKDIDNLVEWTKKWKVTFNADKCHVLTLGKFVNITHTHRYVVSGEELEHVYVEKDLGVTIDENLTFSEHISNKTRSAIGIMAKIRSAFSYLDQETFKKLYISFVRPHLEYAQSMWSPHQAKFVNMLENVQKRATQLVDGLGNLEYSERLRKLKLPSLKYRRLRGDMIEVFKHYNTYDKKVLSASFQPRIRSSRRHQYQLHERVPQDGTTGIQANSFYYRVSRAWNVLPQSVVSAPSIDAFKNRYDQHMENAPILYDDDIE